MCLVVLFLYVFMRNRVSAYKVQVMIKDCLHDSEENMTTANIAPAKTVFPIIDTNLKKSDLLEKGAFSSMYKGILFLGNRKAQVTVAIQEFNHHHLSKFSNQLSKEANIIGSLNHPYVLRLLAISLTSDITMVTQFMPLGDLLQYLRKYNTEIKPKTLITWSLQIAKGMQYLEKHGVVHQNLASRRVLVQSLNQVKVSYFGMTKFLSIEQLSSLNRGEYPFKWLSLETLKLDIFTHKSDVWSFGVVLWEILTLGQEPYVETSVADLLHSLKLGERLEQPESCSADLYSVLATCWTEEVTARPSFQELVDTLTRMVRDPTQFIFASRPEGTTTAPVPLPKNQYCEVDVVGEYGISTSSHSYVNVYKNTELSERESPFIPLPNNAYCNINSDYAKSSFEYVEIQSTCDSE